MFESNENRKTVFAGETTPIEAEAGTELPDNALAARNDFS
jgi:hypothetical protein